MGEGTNDPPLSAMWERPHAVPQSQGHVVGRNDLLYALTRAIARIVFSLFYRVTIEREAGPLPPHPAVILPKHQFWTDIPLVGLSFREGLYFLAKRELFALPGIRTVLSLLGGIPVDRDRSIRTLRSFKHLFSLLQRTERVVIFPEGTYVRGSVGLGKSRLIEMILERQARFERPVLFVPVGIRYGPRTGWRRTVRVRIGRPLLGEKGTDAPSFTSRAMEEISRLSELPRGERGSALAGPVLRQNETPDERRRDGRLEGLRKEPIQNPQRMP